MLFLFLCTFRTRLYLGSAFTVSPLTSQSQSFSQSSSLHQHHQQHNIDRRLSEPATRPLWTNNPSVHPNQLPPLSHLGGEQNVTGYSSSPPSVSTPFPCLLLPSPFFPYISASVCALNSHRSCFLWLPQHNNPYTHQRIPSDSSGSFTDPWTSQKFPPPPPTGSSSSGDLIESTGTATAPIPIPSSYHPNSHGHGRSQFETQDHDSLSSGLVGGENAMWIERRIRL